MGEFETGIGSADGFIEDSLADKKKLILSTVSDLVKDFLLYDRKEDEDLGEGEIETAIGIGIISPEEIVAEFSKRLQKGLSDNG